MLTSKDRASLSEESQIGDAVFSDGEPNSSEEDATSADDDNDSIDDEDEDDEDGEDEDEDVGDEDDEVDITSLGDTYADIESAMANDPLVADIKICGACGREPTMWCDKCNGSPSTYMTESGPVSIAGACYCSKACQEGHFAEHQPACKDLQQRNLIWHTSSLLHLLWAKFKQQACDLSIKSVISKGEYMVVVGEDDGQQRSDRFLRHFPESLAPDTFDQMAVLVYGTSREALIWLRPFLEGILRGKVNSLIVMNPVLTRVGQVSKIETIRAHVKKPARRVIVVNVIGTEVAVDGFHYVWKVTANSGEEWVIDPTSSAFGWNFGAMEWAEWCKSRAIDPQVYQEEHATFKDWMDALLRDDKFSLPEYYRWRERHAAGYVMFQALYKSMTVDDVQPERFSHGMNLFRDGTSEDYNKQIEQVIKFAAATSQSLDHLYKTRGKEFRQAALATYMDRKGLDTSDGQSMKMQEACWMIQAIKIGASMFCNVTNIVENITLEGFEKILAAHDDETRPTPANQVLGEAFILDMHTEYLAELKSFKSGDNGKVKVFRKNVDGDAGGDGCQMQ